MKKTILFFFVLAFLFCANSTHAQYYNSAVGLRLGYPLSISYKHFLTESHAFEAYVGTRGYSGYRWTSVSAAYQIHKPLEIQGIEGLRYYFGGGATMFFWSYKNVDLGESTSFGIQFYLGLDYKLPNSRVSFTLDWVPTYRINGYLSGFGADYGSFGVRYVLSGYD